MDITKIIRTIFRADTDQYQRAMKGVRDITGGALGSIERLNQRIDRLRNMLAGGALGYGLGRLVGGLLKVNQTSETTKIGLATLMQSTERFMGSNIKFGDALQRSGAMLAKLRQEAIDTPGTLQQVSQAFQTVYMRARGAGLKEDEIVKFAGNIATVDSLMGNNGVVGRDVEQLLRGETGDVQTPQLAAIKREVAAMVQQGQMQEAARALVNALDLDPEARKAAGESFEGQLSAAKDQLLVIAEIVGRPLFEEINKALGDMLKWLSQNKDQVEKIAKTVGTVVVDAFKAVMDVVGVLADAVEWLAEDTIARSFVEAVGLVYVAFTLLSKHPIFVAVAGLVAGIVAINKLVNGEKPSAATVKHNRAVDAVNNTSTLEYLTSQGYDYTQGEATGTELTKLGGLTVQAAQAAGVGNPLTPGYVQLSAIKGKFGEGSPEYANAARYFWSRDFNDWSSGLPTAYAGAEDAVEVDRQLAREFGFLNTGGGFYAGDFTDSNQAAAYWSRREELMALFGQDTFSGPAKQTNVKVDARGAKITQNIKLQTNDPARMAGVTLMAGYQDVVSRPLSGRMGLGSIGIATGR